MQKPISNALPADLPDNWTDTQYVSPGGVEVGLSQKHGYNYLCKQINEAHKALNILNEAFEKVLATDGTDTMIGKLWLANRFGAMNSNDQFTDMQSSNRNDDEGNGRTLRVKNSSGEGELYRAVQLVDIVNNVVSNYLLYGQHNRQTANEDVMLRDMNTAPQTDRPLDYPKGVHIYLESIFGQLPNKPSDYGLMLSIRHDDEISQIWFTQTTGTVYRRGGNHIGWASDWVPISGGVYTATVE